MPKVSFVVPVYNAEKTLRKCVESIIYGQERDVEIILVDDCSKDGSWDLCVQLAAEYAQVKCFHNEQNRGVSFTRNRGIDEASGRYLLFVDSDDWVSEHYAERLIKTQEEHPDKMAMCGYLFLDYVSGRRRLYGIKKEAGAFWSVKKEDFLSLAEDVLLLQLWNKLFLLQHVKENNIRFDETVSMGEDYQFVIDYLKAVPLTEGIVINRPLYYYTRRNANSLMSRWGDIENLKKGISRMEQMGAICGPEAAAAAASQIEAIRNQFAVQLLQDKKSSRQEKMEKLRAVIPEGDAEKYLSQNKKRSLREHLAKKKHTFLALRRRIRSKVQFERSRRIVEQARQVLEQKEITLISQNCIGGVFYHDMQLPFLSPTVNAFIPQPDFIRFVNDLKHYIQTPMVMRWGEEYPIGTIEDIEIHFVHYETCREAEEAWERRKQRIMYDRIVVLSTDRDGFTDEVFAAWEKLAYPKVLFTANAKYADHVDSVYFPEYEKDGCIPDIIPSRAFYRDGKLVDRINGTKG